MLISTKDVEWETMSCMDRIGRVFYDNDYCYRGIYNNKQNIRRINQMFKCGLIDELVAAKTILPIHISDINFNDTNEFCMILKSKRIKNVVYPTEWSFSMLVDVTQHMISMERILLKYGYTFADYHPYNVVFDGGHPYHVDLGSIVAIKSDSERSFVEAIEERYYRPLYIWKKSRTSKAEMYLTDRKIVQKEWYEYLFGVYVGENIYKFWKGLNVKDSHDINSLEKKLARLANFDRKNEDNHPDWSQYQNIYISNGSTVTATKRFEIISEVLKEYRVEAITELAANQGAFSQYCLEKGSIKSSVAIDYDEAAVDKMYCRLKNNNAITVGVVDVVTSKSRNYKSSSERLKNEGVVAMALMHHLVLSQGLSMKKALDIILSYGRKYAFVEFMPLGLYSRHTVHDVRKLPKEYTTDNFRQIFRERCEELREIKISKNRILFVGKIREEI